MNIEGSSESVPTSAWIKSSYSGGEGGECVEVAAGPGTVHVRDSKDQQGPQLTFRADEWAAFVSYTTQIR